MIMSNNFEVMTLHLSPNENWRIVTNGLVNLSPDIILSSEIDSDQVRDFFEGYFLQDLVFAVRSDESLLIDVGWYPPKDPRGVFCVQLIACAALEPGQSDQKEYDWDNPVEVFESRDPFVIQAKVQALLAST